MDVLMSLKIIIINLLNQNKMEQTAVEWFFDELYSIRKTIPFEYQADAILKAFEQAKEMERIQIVKAYKKREFNSGCNESSEQYYVKTYKR